MIPGTYTGVSNVTRANSHDRQYIHTCYINDSRYEHRQLPGHTQACRPWYVHGRHGLEPRYVHERQQSRSQYIHERHATPPPCLARHINFSTLHLSTFPSLRPAKAPFLLGIFAFDDVELRQKQFASDILKLPSQYMHTFIYPHASTCTTTRHACEYTNRVKNLMHIHKAIKGNKSKVYHS